MKRILSLITGIYLAACAPALAQEAMPKAAPTSPAQLQLSYANIVKKVAPAVVNIYTKRTVSGHAFNPFANDPFFAPFFESFRPMRKRVEQSLGSGFIIDASGLIVTNAHVIKDAQQIVVALASGQEFEAQSVLVDKASDIGLLRIEASDTALPVATLKTSDALEVGDIVLAIGNPFGVGQTVTSGIVSALARSHTDINDFDFFIQTDAAINPGNSGGPLVDMQGDVVGINSAIYSRSGGSMGIGFAIPGDMAQAVIKAEAKGQISKGKVVRPWLGFSAQSVSADIAASMNLNQPKGALVTSITADSPAAQSGLKRGDVILAINGRHVRDAEELRFRIATVPIGDSCTLDVMRGTHATQLKFVASPPPENPPRAPVSLSGQNILQGATVINVSPAVIEEMALKDQDDGVVVYAVLKGSRAERLGIQAGDGIIAIGNHKVGNTAELVKRLKQAEGQRRFVVSIRRAGRDQSIILR